MIHRKHLLQLRRRIYCCCFSEKRGRVKSQSKKIRPAKLHRSSVVHWCIKRLCSVPPLATLATLQSSLRNHQNSNTIHLFRLLGRRHVNPYFGQQTPHLDPRKSCQKKQKTVPNWGAQTVFRWNIKNDGMIWMYFWDYVVWKSTICTIFNSFRKKGH